MKKKPQQPRQPKRRSRNASGDNSRILKGAVPVRCTAQPTGTNIGNGHYWR